MKGDTPMRNPTLATLTLALLSGAAVAATPQPAKITAAIQHLQDTLAAQEQQLERQRAELAAQRAEIDALRKAAGVAPAQPQDTAVKLEELSATVHRQQLAEQDKPRLTFVANRPAITSPDGRSSIALRSLVQLDAAAYDQEHVSGTDYPRGSVGSSGRETEAATDLSNGTNFRRARIGVEGIFARDFAYRFMAEFGGSGTESQTRINDAWVSYTGFAPFTLQAGAFSPPANMDDGTSPEDSLFIERATPSELSRALAGADGRIGLGVRGGGARWMGALTLTGGVAGESETFDEQRAVVGRLGLLALTATDYNLHLGASGSYVFRLADQGNGATGGPFTSRWRDRPEMRVDSTRLIDTGSIPADGAYAAGVEFGANWRNLYLQAENFWYGVQRRNSTLDDPEFGGYYVQGSWILTGESRRYNAANGSFQNLRPLIPFSGNGGPGAWEIAWRYSHSDLDFEPGMGGLPPDADGIRGGTQDILSVGLNWTVNTNLRFLLDYSQVEVDRLNPASLTSLPFGPAPATPPAGVEIGQDLDIYALRTQFSF